MSEPPNELRIDVAEGGIAKGTDCAPPHLSELDEAVFGK